MTIVDRSIYVSTRWLAFNTLTKVVTQGGAPVKLTRTRDGYSNPKWRQQVRSQTNATTAMTGIFDTRSDVNHSESRVGYSEVKFRDRDFPASQTIYTTWIKGDLLSYVYSEDPSQWLLTLSPSKAYNQALVSYLKKVRKVQVEFSAPTALGEIRETIHMLKHPLQGLSDLAKSYLGKVKRAKGRSRNWKGNLSSLWLEQAFGWQPLIHDITDAYKLYKGHIDSNDQVPVTAFAIEEEAKPTEASPGSLGPDTIGYSFTNTRLQKCTVRFRGMVKRQVQGPQLDNMARWGFTPSEFLPTAWELLPWSFLFDYFSNIGDLITASVAVRSSIAWSNVTTIRFQTNEMTAVHNAIKTRTAFQRYVSSSGDSLSSTRMRRTVSRIINPILETPSLAFELPKNPFQWANMTALFAGANQDIHQQRPVRTWRR